MLGHQSGVWEVLETRRSLVNSGHPTNRYLDNDWSITTRVSGRVSSWLVIWATSHLAAWFTSSSWIGPTKSQAMLTSTARQSSSPPAIQSRQYDSGATKMSLLIAADLPRASLLH